MSPVPRPLWTAHIALLAIDVLTKGHPVAIGAVIASGVVIVVLSLRALRRPSRALDDPHGAIITTSRRAAALYLLAGVLTVGFAILSLFVDVSYRRRQ